MYEFIWRWVVIGHYCPDNYSIFPFSSHCHNMQHNHHVEWSKPIIWKAIPRLVVPDLWGLSTKNLVRFVSTKFWLPKMTKSFLESRKPETFKWRLYLVSSKLWDLGLESMNGFIAWINARHSRKKPIRKTSLVSTDMKRFLFCELISLHGLYLEEQGTRSAAGSVFRRGNGSLSEPLANGLMDCS